MHPRVLVVGLVLSLLLVSVQGAAASPRGSPVAESAVPLTGPIPAVSPAVASGSWTLRGTNSPGRDGHGFVYDSRADRFILFGGAITGTGFTNSTWSYDYGRDAWANITPVVGPSPRAGFGFVYDSHADRLILFGGAVGGGAILANDTWVFDMANDTWSQRVPARSPSARDLFAMAYDAAADRTILYGGNALTGLEADTWAYDYGANTWTPLNAAGPGAVGFNSMTYDPTVQRDILFGGFKFSGPSFTSQFDTWSFDYANRTWTNRNPVSHPSARAASAFSFDTASGRGILFGGTNTLSPPTGAFNDTWAYDSTLNDWSNVTTLTGPSGRILPAMDYDGLANRTVLFGGATASGTPFNDTWAYAYGPALPTAPRNLIATPGASQITLTWQPPASDGGARVANYSIYRGTTSGGEAFLVSVGPTLTYTDTAVTAGPTYYYEVAAVTPAGGGPRSNEASAMLLPPAPPSAPQNLSATAGDAQVVLTWDAPAKSGTSAITGYDVYRSTTAGGETLLTSLGVVLTYTDTAVTNGITYYYEVSAVNGEGEGPKSGEVSATPNVPPAPPSAPLNLAATAGNAQVVLTWQAPASTGATAISAYKVYRGTASGGETLLATLGMVLTYTDTGAANGQTYYYEVSAVNGDGEGPKSAEVSATPSAPPSAPQQLTATAGNAQVALTWQAPASNGGSAVTGYKVYRGTTSGGETLLTSVGNVLAYTDSTAANGQTYYYEVSAVNAAGEGPKSTEAHATPAAPADTTPPSIRIASPANNSVLASTTVAVTGTASDDVAVQKVELSTDGSTWTLATGTGSWSGTVTLVAGANTIYARATDTAGNTRTVQITVTLRTTGPAPQGLDLALVSAIVIVVVIAAVAVALLLWRRRRKPEGPPPGGTV